MTIETYYETAVRLGAYANVVRMGRYMRFLFDRVPFEGRRVLDIGGGNGYLSFYAAARGARECLCLEPTSDGGDDHNKRVFAAFQKDLSGQGSVHLKEVPFQNYEWDGQSFDVVMMHDSINHLDESSCRALKHDASARAAYQKVFSKLSDIMTPGGTLILTDCSRYNVFPLLGLPNPFVPTITWDIHQSPWMWASLLKTTGFVSPRIRWRPVNRLGHVGRYLLGNAAASFFLASHFCLTMKTREVGRP